MKKALNIVKNILVWALAAFSVFMMIFTVISVKTFDKYDKSLFGFYAYTVLTDSMSESGIDSGSIVFVKKVDPATLKPGDIISYQPVNNMSGGTTITHMIRRLTVDAEGNPGFITYGTTTNVDDETVVTYPYVTGKYQFHIPFIGAFFQFVKSTPGYISCIFIPFALLLVYNGANCVTLFRRYRKEQLADLQAEKDRLSAEREENAKVLAELRALRQQLAGGGVQEAPAQPIAPQAPPASPAPAAEQTAAQAAPAAPQYTAPVQSTAPDAAQPVRRASEGPVRPAVPAAGQNAAPQRVRTVRPAPAAPERPAPAESSVTAPARPAPAASPEAVRPTAPPASAGDAPALRRPRARRR